MSWANLQLATADDLRSRFKRADEATGEETPEDQTAVLEEYAQKAKDYIGRILDTELRVRWGYKHYAASDLKDLIGNPEVLNPACVAWALRLLCEEAAMSEGDYYDVRMRDFEKEFKREFDIGLTLLTMDDNESGAIEDEEKAEKFGMYRFYRT